MFNMETGARAERIAWGCRSKNKTIGGGVDIRAEGRESDQADGRSADGRNNNAECRAEPAGGRVWTGRAAQRHKPPITPAWRKPDKHAAKARG